MKLVLVESPTKARTLSRFLKGDFQIEATMGHVRDLPEDELGINIKIIEKDNKELDYEFYPKYKTIKGRRKRVTEIKKIAKTASQIILATDPDREGEAIAYHAYKLLGKGQSEDKFSRIVFHEITSRAITNALKSPKSIDDKLVDAQQARRVLDRLVGYKVSPLLWSKLGKNWLSAGRVQSIALRLIVEREREIEAFKPEEYWNIDAELKKQEDKALKFLARLVKIDDKRIEVTNIKDAQNIVGDLKKASYLVDNIQVKEHRKNPSPPFTTSTLQQVSSNRFHWSARRTMRLAQTLYEQGFITYHRTDSTNLAKEAVESVRTYVNNMFGQSYLPEKPTIYKTKSKVAQEAHEAIRPTNVLVLASRDFKWITGEKQQKYNLRKISEKIGRDAELMYSIIWKRFVACQMKYALFDRTRIEILAEYQKKKYLLKTTGEVQKFDGWLVLYQSIAEKSKEVNLLPKLEEKEPLDLLQVLSEQKFTEPPARYSEAALIKALEEKGIGRPSTYAPIITTIQNRKYVEKIERRFHPTDLGIVVNDFLVSHFADVFDVYFTAKMEDSLDDIANGEKNWTRVISNFYAPFIKKLDDVYKTTQKVKVEFGKTDKICKKCKSPMAVRLSKYGKFLACTAYPKCTYKENIVEKIDIPCPKCKGDIVVKKSRKGKRFYGCSNYPKCTFAAWKKEQIRQKV